MSNKRKHAEISDNGRGPETLQKRQRGKFHGKHQGPTRISAKHKKTKGSKSTHDSKTNGTGSLRNRIRDLKRLLQHADDDPKNRMPANIRIERERELEACKHELAEKTAATQEAEHRRKMISKYHQVRFFERQRATRNLKRLRRKLTEIQDDAQKEELLRHAHVVEVDLNYALYYPLMKPYSALYPRDKRERTGSEEPNAEGADYQKAEGTNTITRGDPEIWRKIEKAMEDGTLETLRDSKLAQPASSDPSSNKNIQSKQKKAHLDKKKSGCSTTQQTLSRTKATTVQDDGDESDGGFFE